MILSLTGYLWLISASSFHFLDLSTRMLITLCLRGHHIFFVQIQKVLRQAFEKQFPLEEIDLYWSLLERSVHSWDFCHRVSDNTRKYWLYRHVGWWLPIVLISPQHLPSCSNFPFSRIHWSQTTGFHLVKLHALRIKRKSNASLFVFSFLSGFC